MSVFVITRAFDCEGESPVGVAASLERAKSIAERQAAEYGYDWAAEWVPVSKGFELQYAATQWVVREEEVQG